MKSYSLYQPPPRFRWPDNSNCCVMLCFDVDGETTALSEDPTLKNRLTTYFVLTLHPWLSGRPSRVRLLERLVRSIQQKERTWFAAGQQIATYFRENPDARHEIDFEREEVAGNNFSLSLSSHERWST